MTKWICLNCGEINEYDGKVESNNVDSYHCKQCLGNRKTKVCMCND